MKSPKAADVKKGIAALWETMQCPICLDLFTEPVSTKCDHQFCKFCILKLLDNSKENKSKCPVCKNTITKRSLQESSGFKQLVAGLQDMIQGYEQDTGTNYFTGTRMPQKQSSVSDAEGASHPISEVSGDTPVSESAECDELPMSCSSTLAAQNGFARLMNIEDSSPLTAENEGLDSGLGDAPPTFEKKLQSSPDNLEQMGTDIIDAKDEATANTKGKSMSGKLTETSPNQIEVPAETENQSPIKSLRKKRKKNVDSDMVHQEKRKKSLQKVAEWLLKVPTEESLESQEDDMKNDSDSASSSSTIDVNLQISDMKREDRSRALEEQVFGAVYKRRRERRLICPLPPAGDEALTAVELKTGSEDEDQGDSCSMKSVTEEIRDSNSDIIEEAEQIEEVEENDIDSCGEILQKRAEIKENKSKEEDIATVSGSKQVSKANTNNALQHVDSDLQEQDETELETSQHKKTDRKKGKNAQSRVAKPLVLVGVQNAESNSKIKLRSEQVQVQIENYPSSDDQETTIIRSTRRSRRLQLFATEVSKVQGNAKLKTSVAENLQVSENPPTEGKGEAPTNLDMSMMNMSKRNGCVYNQDLGGIELMESSQPSSYPEQKPVAEVPVHTEALVELKAAGDVVVVPTSASPSDVTVVHPTFETNKASGDLSEVVKSGEFVCDTGCEVTENEEKNDSEVDTQLLLKSFKATKRKSFHLGCAAIKKSRSSDQLIARDSFAEEEEAEEPSHEQDTLLHDGNSLSEDVIPPSNSSLLDRKPTVMQDQVAADPLMPVTCSNQGCAAEVLSSIPSSALTPNKESKFDKESPHLSAVPQIVDSQLCYIHINQAEPHGVLESSHIPNTQCDSSHRDSVKSEESRGSISVEKDQGNTAEHISAADSLTPDGLVTQDVQMAKETKSSNCDRSSQSSSSSVMRNPRQKKKKKKRIQIVESSSESDAGESKEELPSLSQFLGKSSFPVAAAQEQGDCSESGGNEYVCVTPEVSEDLGPSPSCQSPDYVDPSQASVDLFGTPEECDVPANPNTVSMESSEFSSDVLVTQEKIQMQNELVRLEKLMALVSEVLQEKESSPAKQTHQNSQATDSCCKDTSHDLKKTGVSDADPLARSKESDDRDVHQPGLSTPTTDTSKAKTILSSATKTPKSSTSPSDAREDKENDTPPKDRTKAKLVLVLSGLGPVEQVTVKRFAKSVGGRVVPQVTPDVTHVIMHTDEHLVCQRTLKYFLGIAGRKWVLSFNWVSECVKQKKLLDEHLFEVKGDMVNGPDHQGPARARTTEDSNLLLKGYKICFHESFTDMTRDEMEWMAELCGAAIVDDPLLFDRKQKSHQVLIVGSGPTAPSPNDSSLSRRATVVTRGWLLDTVSTYTLQNYQDYSL